MATNIVNRTDVSGLIPEPVTREIIQGVTEGSAVLQMGRRLPNMTSKTETMNVLDMLPTAYFVNGDTGMKQTTKMKWDKKRIYAEEIAVIVPIPEAVLDDADYDIWGEVRPRLVEAFGKVIDGAILFGTNKPTSWRDSVLETCTKAGSVVAATPYIYDDLLAEGGVIAKVEESGYFVNGFMSAIQMRAKLRGLKDLDGAPLFKTDMQGATSYALDGSPMYFPQTAFFVGVCLYAVLPSPGGTLCHAFIYAWPLLSSSGAVFVSPSAGARQRERKETSAKARPLFLYPPQGQAALSVMLLKNRHRKSTVCLHDA
jgi:HK97 family phage major capsid protein